MRFAAKPFRCVSAGPKRSPEELSKNSAIAAVAVSGLRKILGELDPVNAGHVEINDAEVERLTNFTCCPGERQGLVAVDRLHRLDPPGVQLSAQDEAVRRIVVDDQGSLAGQAMRDVPSRAVASATFERSQGEFEPERRTRPRSAHEAEVPTHQVDELPTDRKAETGAAESPGRRGVGL